MNRIVREHFPVTDLPESLREGLEASNTARVIVEADPTLGETSKPFSLESLDALARPRFTTENEIVDYVRLARDACVAAH
jgi:hypothetical protein